MPAFMKLFLEYSLITILATIALYIADVPLFLSGAFQYYMMYIAFVEAESLRRAASNNS